MKRLPPLSWLAFLLFLSAPATAGSILVSSPGYDGYTVGGSEWTQFTQKLEAASGGQVFFASNFEDLNQMLAYDALLLPARNPGNKDPDHPADNYVSETLSAQEVANLSAFIATGRRVLMFGENDNWREWNQQVVSIAGGAYVAEPYNTYWNYSTKLLSHEITNGADSLYSFWVGVAAGGTQLYAPKNFVTLWGAPQNVLTILDENVVQDGYQGEGQDAQFTTNVANWLAGGGQPVPEPTSLLLWGTILLGLGAVKKRH